MDSICSPYASKIKFIAPAGIHGMPLKPFFHKPIDDFKRRNDHGIRSFQNPFGIQKMILMPVCDQNVISRDLINIDFFCQRISRNEGIYKNGFIMKVEGKTGVSEISNIHKSNRFIINAKIKIFVEMIRASFSDP